MITVFGAHGNTGSVVASTLLDAGERVRVVARSADKLAGLRERGAEVVAGDVTDPATVDRALAGAVGAYLLVPPSADTQDTLARARTIVANYQAALTRHGVRHAVFLSSTGAEHATGTGPIRTVHHAEAELQGLATAITFVRAAYFMENILANAYPMKHDGVLPVFGGGEAHAFPMVATRDIGQTAAAALLSPPATTSWLELEGPRPYSFADAAAEASRILGRPVTATAVPIDRVVPTLTQLGFSEDVAGLYREMIEGLGSGRLAFEGKGRRVTGSTPLADVLRALA